tara:strand:+ start:241 stop:351 length:111 start_codon:yes stop_codon:yes gene_type:complete
MKTIFKNCEEYDQMNDAITEELFGEDGNEKDKDDKS